MTALNLKKSFEEADKEKAGFIKYSGLQVVLNSLDAFGACTARKVIALINKTGKISLDELQHICESKPGSFVLPSPKIDAKLQTYPVPTSLAGLWTNELSSKMFIFGSSYAEGQIIGLYCSQVGDAYAYYDLNGLYDTDGDKTGGTLGWTVQWNNSANGNSYSNTAWSGQRYEISGKLYIYTTWLLVSQETLEDNWKSTLTGKDKFWKDD